MGMITTKNWLLGTIIGLGLFLCIGCQQPDQDLAKLKQELKQEILTELRQQNGAPPQRTAQAMPAEMPVQTHDTAGSLVCGVLSNTPPSM